MRPNDSEQLGCKIWTLLVSLQLICVHCTATSTYLLKLLILRLDKICLKLDRFFLYFDPFFWELLIWTLETPNQFIMLCNIFPSMSYYSNDNIIPLTVQIRSKCWRYLWRKRVRNRTDIEGFQIEPILAEAASLAPFVNRASVD